MLFELEIPDKPIKDSSFNQCLWQLKKDGNGIMGKFTELLTNSDNWKSSRCTMEWKAEYIKNERYIFILNAKNQEKESIENYLMLPTPTVNESKNTTFPKSQYDRSSLIGFLMKMLPTPRANDTNHSTKVEQPSFQHRKNKRYMAEVVISFTNPPKGINCHLNPQFVLEMMGFPIDFTEKPFQNLE